MKTYSQVATFLAGVVFLSGAIAETNIGNKVLGKEDFLELLSEPPVIRGIVLHDATDRQQSPASGISMQTHFEYNSANLTGAARGQLQGLGEALASGELDGAAFVIEGHTDASGSDSYNQALSQKRAESVRTFLQSEYSIQNVKIDTVGLGEQRLWNTSEPTSWENRRVSIRRVK